VLSNFAFNFNLHHYIKARAARLHARDPAKYSADGALRGSWVLSEARRRDKEAGAAARKPTESDSGGANGGATPA
jgi:hypothetical protein